LNTAALLKRARLCSAPAVVLILTVLFAVSVFAADQPVRPILGRNPAIPAIQFAASEIQRAFAAKSAVVAECSLDDALKNSQNQSTRILVSSGDEDNRRIIAALKIAPLHSTNAQAYAIRVRRDAVSVTIAVLGADATGAMYGGLDVAEALRLGTLDSLADSDHSPLIARRGIKFNIPLDLRTPSYTDNSDAAQQNIPEMWSLDFWRDFLDEMARDRFNVLTLWNLHPFPSLVKVPEFPDIALNDVWRTRKKFDDTYSHSGSDMVRPALLQDVEVVRTLSIDQKIQFWRQVMQLANDRGIEVYWFTWNIFTFGAEGKYGITRSQTNPKTIEYFRDSLREMVLTYPLLAGVGITAGEQMSDRTDEFSKEKWLWNAYGEGIRDALKQQPGREFRLIHRYHQTVQEEILSAWKDYPGPLDLSFKYAIAHMYSATNPPFITPALPGLSPKLRSWLTVRNDDIYSFRWGDPEFARGFIRAIPGADKVAGFYMGPDGYIWGRDFLGNEPDSPRQLVISKQWYSFMLWGRLSYEPDLPDDLFRRAIAERLSANSSEDLFKAWAEASEIFPQITRFFWGDIDIRWFPEGCLSDKSYKGFYTVRDFIEGSTMPGTRIMNIVEWRRGVMEKQSATNQTPLQVAENLQRFATTTLNLLPGLRAANPNPSKELRLTLGDLEAFAHIGNYYAEKIQGACDLALFDLTGEASQRDSAARHLEAASEHWKKYAAAYTRQYVQPVLYNRVGFVNIPALQSKVDADIALARDWKPGTIKDAAIRRSAADQPFLK
jgi:hypothetical protein